MTGKWNDKIYFLIVLIIDLAIFLTTAKSGIPVYHDNLSLGYPGRVLISTSINNGIFPLWDHWVNGGNAMTSVYSAANLSPVIWILSLFGVYTIGTFLIEIVLMHVLCFLGMYLWLKTYVNHHISLFGCLCYSLSSYLLIQTPINFEAIVSASMIIWFAYGFKVALARKRIGIGISAISLWIMFTTGYLGLNIIQLQFIIIFCIAEFIISSDYIRTRDYLPIIKAIGYACIGFLLFLMIFNFAIFETYHYLKFNFSQIRLADFNPYNASISSLSSIYTFLFPNRISTFSRYGTALFYCGTLMFFFFLYGCLQYKRDIKIILMALTTVVLFCSMLNQNYQIAVLFNHIIPFLNKVQYHGWNISLILFFVVTLGCIGAKYFLENKNVGSKFPYVFIAIYLLFVLLQSKDANYMKYLLYPQTFTIMIFTVLFAYVCRGNNFTLPLAGYKKEKETDPTQIQRKNIIILTLLTAAEIAMVSPSLVFCGNVLKPWENIILNLDKVKNNKFDVAGNKRENDGCEIINFQYYSKIPVIHGYNPSMHPSMFKLKQNTQVDELLKKIFYQSDKNAIPIKDSTVNVKITTLSPNEISAEINSQEDDILMVWSSPYTSNWVLRDGDKIMRTNQNEYGLTTFTINRGIHTINFKYHPPYLFISIIISIVGILLSLAFIFPLSENKHWNPGAKSNASLL